MYSDARQLSWVMVLRMRKEEVTGYFKELAQHLSGGTDKTTNMIIKATWHSPRKSNMQSPKYEGDVLSPKSDVRQIRSDLNKV